MSLNEKQLKEIDNIFRKVENEQIKPNRIVISEKKYKRNKELIDDIFGIK